MSSFRELFEALEKFPGQNKAAALPVKSPARKPARKKFSFGTIKAKPAKPDDLACGAVWHGDWSKGMLGKASFGATGNQHFAASTGSVVQTKIAPGQSFFPITSEKRNNAVAVLPPGVLCANPKTSYIVPVTLLIAKDDLRRKFSFNDFLPEKYSREIAAYFTRGYKNRRKTR